MPSQTASMRIEVAGVNRMRGALRVMGEDDAPFIHTAMADVNRFAAHSIAGHAKGGIAGSVTPGGVKGSGVGIRAIVLVRHPGAKTQEFGDYFGGRGGRRKGGVPWHPYPKGQRPQPYVGVEKGGQAFGEIAPYMQAKLAAAFEHEWERLAAKGVPGEAD